MSNTLAPREVALALPGFTLSATGLTVDGNPSFEEWAEAFETVRRVSSGVRWWVGDLLVAGEERFGEQYAQVLDAADYEQQTMANLKSVAARVDRSRRREALSFEHHDAVASLPADEQESFLSLAERDGLTRQQLADSVQRHKREVNGQAYDLDRDIQRFRSLFDRLRKNWTEEGHRGRMRSLFTQLAEEV